MTPTQRGARAILAAALTIVPASSTASSCGGSGSSSSTSPATKAAAAPVPNADANAGTNPAGPSDCKVLVEVPKVVNKSVLSYLLVKCGETPDLYQITGFLDLNDEPRDSCHQAFSWNYGEHCELVADCEPGEWTVAYTAMLGVPGFDPSDQVDQGTTKKNITRADCGG
jgi:hypothetical protein